MNRVVADAVESATVGDDHRQLRPVIHWDLDILPWICRGHLDSELLQKSNRSNRT